MHTVFALLCFIVVIHWLIFPYPSGLLHWHCGNLTIAPVPAKQPWWIWIITSCEFVMNDCITTTKQSTTKPCAYFLGYTVRLTSIIMMSHESHGVSKLRQLHCLCNSFRLSTNLNTKNVCYRHAIPHANTVHQTIFYPLYSHSGRYRTHMGAFQFPPKHWDCSLEKRAVATLMLTWSPQKWVLCKHRN